MLKLTYIAKYGVDLLLNEFSCGIYHIMECLYPDDSTPYLNIEKYFHSELATYIKYILYSVEMYDNPNISLIVDVWDAVRAYVMRNSPHLDLNLQPISIQLGGYDENLPIITL